MILDPDFLDHWKTRMLVDLLGGDECAPLYVIRIWGHCQARRAVDFDITPIALKAICRAPHDASTFEAAMIEAGFVDRDGPTLRVPKWAEHNPKLVANWRNGGSGGRPAKPKGNPPETQRETQSEPSENPTETQPEPTENPTGTESEIGLTHWKPVGEGRVGEEKNKLMSGKPDPEPRADHSDAVEILGYLNARAGKAFRPVKSNVGLVLARLREGASVDDCKAVIDAKVAQWLGDAKMSEFLRPATLFGREKFAQYLGHVGSKQSPSAQWWLKHGHGTRDAAIAAGMREPDHAPARVLETAR